MYALVQLQEHFKFILIIVKGTVLWYSKKIYSNKLVYDTETNSGQNNVLWESSCDVCCVNSSSTEKIARCK